MIALADPVSPPWPVSAASLFDPSEAGKLPGFDCIVEARVAGGATIAELHQYRWRRPQSAKFQSSRGFLDLALTRRAPRAFGQYLDGGGEAVAIGELLYIPAGQSLMSRWDAGEQRSICCPVDLPPDVLQCFRGDLLPRTLDLHNGLIRTAMMRLAAEAVTPGFGSAILVEALGAVIAVELARLFSVEPEAERSAGRLSPRQLNLVRELLDQRKPPSLSSLAAACGMSIRQFSRLFRNATGESVTGFAGRARAEMAKALLLDRGLMIKEVAWRCGFDSAAAFTTAFRRMVGVSPSDFRTGCS